MSPYIHDSFKKYFMYVCENMHTHGGKSEVDLWNSAFPFYLMSPETELRSPCLAAHAFILSYFTSPDFCALKPSHFGLVLGSRT